MWSARKESTPRSTMFGFRPLAWVMVMFLPQASFGSDGVAASGLFCRSHWHAAIDAPVRRRPAMDLAAVIIRFAYAFGQRAAVILRPESVARAAGPLGMVYDLLHLALIDTHLLPGLHIVKLNGHDRFLLSQQLCYPSLTGRIPGKPQSLRASDLPSHCYFSEVCSHGIG